MAVSRLNVSYPQLPFQQFPMRLSHYGHSALDNQQLPFMTQFNQPTLQVVDPNKVRNRTKAIIYT
jgi:hypothetical protein